MSIGTYHVVIIKNSRIDDELLEASSHSEAKRIAAERYLKPEEQDRNVLLFFNGRTIAVHYEGHAAGWQ